MEEESLNSCARFLASAELPAERRRRTTNELSVSTKTSFVVFVFKLSAWRPKIACQQSRQRNLNTSRMSTDPEDNEHTHDEMRFNVFTHHWA